MNDKHETKTRKRRPGSAQRQARREKTRISDYLSKLKRGGPIAEHPNFGFLDPRSLSQYCDCPLCTNGAELVELGSDGETWQLTQAAKESSDHCFPTEVFRSYQREEDMTHGRAEVCAKCLRIVFYTAHANVPFATLCPGIPSPCCSFDDMIAAYKSRIDHSLQFA